jgi:hypothetical protein
MCATCFTHYIVHFTSLTIGKFTNYNPYYAVFFGVVWIADILLTTLFATPSIHVTSVGRRCNILHILNDKKKIWEIMQYISAESWKKKIMCGSLGIDGHRWEDNIKMDEDLSLVGCCRRFESSAIPLWEQKPCIKMNLSAIKYNKYNVIDWTDLT